MKLTFTCAACHRESPTTGRKAAWLLGVRTWVCGPCKLGGKQRGRPAQPMRELLLAKINLPDGIPRGRLLGRIAEERRDEAALEIDRIGEWEAKVGACSKRGFSTFMTDADDASDRRDIFDRLNIRARVEWSKTTRGGQQFDLLGNDEPLACASSYGLCE